MRSWAPKWALCALLLLVTGCATASGSLEGAVEGHGNGAAGLPGGAAGALQRRPGRRLLAQSSCALETGVEYSGGTFATVKTSSAAACCGECAKRSACWRHSWNKGTFVCSLKSTSVTRLTGRTAFISGALTAARRAMVLSPCRFEDKVAYTGGTLLTSIDAIGSAGECCKRCAGNSRCARYNWNWSTKKCNLKAGTTTRTTGQAYYIGGVMDSALRSQLVTTTASVTPPPPRVFAYLTNWAQYRPVGCVERQTPADFNATLATHVVFAFAYLTPNSTLQKTEWNDGTLWREATALKAANPSLKVLLAVGGWSMNDPALDANGTVTNPYCYRFSDMVANATRRAAFIRSALNVSATYGFDGIDIDWEYVGADDRCGRPGDRANLVKLAAEFKNTTAAARGAAGPLLLTMAVGATPWGYDGIDLAGLAPHVDAVNLMTYDNWGAWEFRTNYHTAWASPLTWFPTVSKTLDHFLGAGFPPAKLSVGYAAYGRTWTLASPNATAPGSEAAVAGWGGAPGACTGDSGFLSYAEIAARLAPTGGNWTLVEDLAVAKAAYAYKGTQWVTFDTPTTLRAKMDAAAARGVTGRMLWAADLDSGGRAVLATLKNHRSPATVAV